VNIVMTINIMPFIIDNMIVDGLYPVAVLGFSVGGYTGANIFVWGLKGN